MTMDNIEMSMIVKPIFHCNAKPLALGVCVGQYPQSENCAFGIPTCWCLKLLKCVSPPTQTLKYPQRKPPNANPPTQAGEIYVGSGPQREGLALAMHISCCLSRFWSHWLPNANAISSGMSTSVSTLARYHAIVRMTSSARGHVTRSDGNQVICKIHVHVYKLTF